MRAAIATATRSSHDTETRERLLRAALRLFGERGFKHVTVREICRVARANVAAINYHFGDKLGLYREIVQSAIDHIRATNEAARRAGEGGSPEEKLRKYIVIFNQRLMTAGVEELHRVISREMHEPTPALDALVEQGFKPRLEYVSTMVADVLRCDRHDPRVLRCAASVQVQSIAYMPNAVAARLGLRTKLTAAQVDEVAQHIADFSMAGIRAIAAARRIH